MTRQSKLIILIAYLLTLAVVMFVYRSNRAKLVKRLNTELATMSADIEKTRATEAEAARLTRLMPTKTDTSAFIEALYLAARESGVTEHEVATEAGKASGTARPGGADTSSITRQRLKISVGGSYRTIAEYVRRVQNIERSHRVTELRLAQDSARLKAALTIELYTLPAKQ